MRITSDKKLLQAFNLKRWAEFIQDSNEDMLLPEVSIMPGRSASSRIDTYKKKIIGNKHGCHVKVITKNDAPEAYAWQTTPEKLATAVRWGIIHTESITSRVIGTLGHYRVAAHELIEKGMISNTHATKMALIDLYQDRFEKLQQLESLVNQKNSKDKIIESLNDYMRDLGKISASLDDRFTHTELATLSPTALDKIKSDLTADIARADAFQQLVESGTSLRSINRAKGYFSILEFVKNQMTYNLYELQGINQDISFSTNRRFALTRGRLNDSIEDARKEINDHQTDLRNLVGKKHHGQFGQQGSHVVYDFSTSHLTPDQERKAMMAVSFIEGWDKVCLPSEEQPHPQLADKGDNRIELKVIAATRWNVTRNIQALGRKVGLMLLNMVKSFVISTKPWKEDEIQRTENERAFHSTSRELKDHSKLNKPLWLTPFTIIKRLASGFKDIFHGITNTGKELLVRMPVELVSDWESSKSLPDFNTVRDEAEQHISRIHADEHDRLEEILENTIQKYNKNNKATLERDWLDRDKPSNDVTIAHQDYPLRPGQANDILNSLVRGLTEFSDYFTHQLFAKNPVAGCLFLTTYGIAGAAIMAPSYVSFLGPKLIALQGKIGFSMGSTKLTAAVSAASIESQLMYMASDGVMHGPSGLIGDIGYEFIKNPLRLASLIAIAYGTGYLLSEGIAGYRIPGKIGDVLHDEVNGSTMNYVILGAKFLIGTHALFNKQEPYRFVKSEFSRTGDELTNINIELDDKQQQLLQRFVFAKWLADNYQKLPKLPLALRCQLERHIDAQFSGHDAKSLRKLIRHEKNRSIAFQLLAIPLSYIPAVLRVVASVFVCIVALAYGHKHPLQPIKNATEALARKTSKDLSRLLVFGTELTRVLVSIATSIVKMFAFVITMAVARVSALFNLQPSHATHRFFAHAHVALRKLREVFYPVKAIKHNIVANPKSTVNRFESSYDGLCKKLGVKAALRIDDNEQEALPVTQPPINLTQEKGKEENSQPLLLESANGFC